MYNKAGEPGEQGEQPQQNYWGSNYYILLPQFFFCNLQLKVTLQTARLLFVRILLTQKFEFSKIPQLLGLCPRPHCTLHIPFSKNTCCIKLYLEFDCLDCFSPIIASPTEKSFNFCSPNRKVVPVPMHIHDEFFGLATSRTRGHPFKLYKRFSSSSTRSSFFSERLINCWNRLPNSGDFSYLLNFRKSLDAIDCSLLTG